MNEIEKELKLSKKQNYNDRYNYLCSQFNGIEYAIKLEKYTNKLLKENSQLKQQLKDKDEKINNLINLLIQMVFDDESTISLYQELVARKLVNLEYLTKKDGYYIILESNKED